MADEPRPPFVRFEVRAIEDRAASIEQGCYVAKDIIFALITPAGSKDVIERVADEWIAANEELVKQDRMPSTWNAAFRRALEDFKEGRETPTEGSPITDWGALSPGQVNLLLNINVRTVEQLAEANEETVTRIGMGGRALKARAQAFLDSKDGGKVAAELDDLRHKLAELAERDEKREAELKALRTENEALKKVKEKA